MMNQQEIILASKEFISGQLDIRSDYVDPDKDLKSMGMDSFRIIELVLFLERKTRLSFPDHAYTPQNLKSVNTIANCFMKLHQ